MSAKQVAFDGFTTELERERPDTFVRCETCDEWVLRSRTKDHEGHTLVNPERFREEAEEEEEDEDPPEMVGAWYDVTLNYTVRYRFSIPAWSEYEAIYIGKEWHWDAPVQDSHLVHKNAREKDRIMSDDPELPEDWDPYGEERLADVLLDYE